MSDELARLRKWVRQNKLDAAGYDLMNDVAKRLMQLDERESEARAAFEQAMKASAEELGYEQSAVDFAMQSWDEAAASRSAS